jgi:hypothetical protein
MARQGMHSTRFWIRLAELHTDPGEIQSKTKQPRR